MSKDLHVTDNAELDAMKFEEWKKAWHAKAEWELRQHKRQELLGLISITIILLMMVTVTITMWVWVLRGGKL